MPPLHEDTIVKVKLAHIVSVAVAVILFLGGWMWKLQEDLHQLQISVTRIEASVVPSPHVASIK